MATNNVTNVSSTIGTLNVAESITYGAAPRRPELLALAGQLNALWQQLDEAQQRGELPAPAADAAKARVHQAARAVEQGQPGAEGVREHLEGAKLLLDGLTAAAGLLPAFTAASEALGKLLP